MKIWKWWKTNEENTSREEKSRGKENTRLNESMKNRNKNNEKIKEIQVKKKQHPNVMTIPNKKGQNKTEMKLLSKMRNRWIV